ncbi:MAG: NADH-quinone oxidoreductase subunit [Solirubrobacterales bacterium]|jgi:NADH-quinone oxidoreductase subunit L|nr:NADH-quinone oxidoreductase subunit [Solirubrobacterales bacterium]
MSATGFAWLVLIFPLAGSILIGLGYRRWSGRTAGLIGTGAIALSFASSIGAFVVMLGEPEDARQLTSTAWDYATSVGLDIQLGILVDPLSVVMCLVVSGVSMLIHLYASAYMVSDQGYTRFFAYLNFFVFSMLLLVLAGNFVLLVVGWAFVGFASYALISFWYRRNTATTAGMKAFVINVIGDIGLVLAAFLIFREFGAFDYLTVFEEAPSHFDPDSGTIVAICLLLLVGAFAKSAQLPLHTWLPDAMEGPTPVSALIHAATMVTAGVYLIARMHPLFELAPTAADIAAFGGLATLIVAATIALVVTDLKRIIAYSTMSQIGYMIVAVSIGAYTAGIFHLMTHAFFKALLFMAAGSIIAAMAGNQNIDRMAGFRKAMPFTSFTLIVGALALAGFPLMSGFFSKDEIMVFAAERGGMYWIFAIGGYAAAFLTAFYAFRIGFRVVLGDPCPEAKELEEGHLHHGEHANPVTGEMEDTEVGFPGSEHHIAERAPGMKIAMAVLAFLSIVAGVFQLPGITDSIEEFLAGSFEDSALFHIVPSDESAYLGLLVGGFLSIAGIGLAYLAYVRRPGLTGRLRSRMEGVHGFLQHKWYFDEIIDFLVYRPVIRIGQFFNNVIERVLVDGIVSATVGAVREVGLLVRGAQSGFVRAYALLVLGGFAALALYFLVVSS